MKCTMMIRERHSPLYIRWKRVAHSTSSTHWGPIKNALPLFLFFVCNSTVLVLLPPFLTPSHHQKGLHKIEADEAGYFPRVFHLRFLHPPTPTVIDHQVVSQPPLTLFGSGVGHFIHQEIQIITTAMADEEE